MSTPLAQFMPLFPATPATDELKLKFAKAYARNRDDAYAAARTIEADYGRAQHMAMNWISDPIVLEYLAETEDDDAEALPTKDEFAAELLRQARETKSSAVKLDYMKLFATVMGFVEKPRDNSPQVNVAIVNKVMRMPRSSTDDEARQRIAANQARLINAVADA